MKNISGKTIADETTPRKNTLDLDTLIPRASITSRKLCLETFRFPHINSLTMPDLEDRTFSRIFRKPDFYEQTIQWDYFQGCEFINTIIQNKKIKPIQLWRSYSHIFILDGVHELSILKAWIEEDYGTQFTEQAKNLINQKIGRYKKLRNIYTHNAPNQTPARAEMLKTLFTKLLPVEWVKGNAEEIAYLYQNHARPNVNPEETMENHPITRIAS